MSLSVETIPVSKLRSELLTMSFDIMTPSLVVCRLPLCMKSSTMISLGS